MDKLLVLPVLARTIFAALSRLITNPFISGPKANTLFKDIAYAALRVNLSEISPAQEQWTNPTTESVYLDFARKARVEPDVTTLDSGVKVAWLGPKTAEKVVLYFHGGGYVLAASTGHVKWVAELQQDLSKGQDVAVVLLTYTLAPRAQYPTQLRQAAESLKWLIDTEQRKASNVRSHGQRNQQAGICSDALADLYRWRLGRRESDSRAALTPPTPASRSCGNVAYQPVRAPRRCSADLSLGKRVWSSVLSSRPHADFLDPQVNFSPEQDSVRRNATSDMITARAAKRWSSLFMGNSSLDNYNQPVLAEWEWFSNLDSVVKDILVWGGGGEVLIDSIQVIERKLRKAHPRTEYVEQPHAGHEDFIIEKLLGYTAKAEGTKVVESWIAARL